MRHPLLASMAPVASVLVLATSFALGGCNSKVVRESPGGGPVSFAADPSSDGPSVTLRGRTAALAPSRLEVEVVARGAPDLHGAAFRVTWDPAALTFVEAKSEAPWSKNAMAMAKEGAPGQLAVVWTEQGERSIDASKETVLGTLVFHARGHKATPLTFKVERSQLVDKKGERVEAQWRGGTIPAR